MGKKERYPDHSDIKEVMDNVGGWARNWDDVLWYVEGPAVYDADFARHEIPLLKNFVQDAQKKGVPFRPDYRQVWHDVTGEDASKLPPQEGVKSHGIDPRRLAKDLEEKVEFPADKDAIVKAAEQKRVPQRELEVLQGIEKKQYRDVYTVIEEVGDLTWDHD